jgi:hypothetical protein
VRVEKRGRLFVYLELLLGVVKEYILDALQRALRVNYISLLVVLRDLLKSVDKTSFCSLAGHRGETYLGHAVGRFLWNS